MTDYLNARVTSSPAIVAHASPANWKEETSPQVALVEHITTRSASLVVDREPEQRDFEPMLMVGAGAGAVALAAVALVAVRRRRASSSPGSPPREVRMEAHKGVSNPLHSAH